MKGPGPSGQAWLPGGRSEPQGPGTRLSAPAMCLVQTEPQWLPVFPCHRAPGLPETGPKVALTAQSPGEWEAQPPGPVQGHWPRTTACVRQGLRCAAVGTLAALSHVGSQCSPGPLRRRSPGAPSLGL